MKMCAAKRAASATILFGPARVKLVRGLASLLALGLVCTVLGGLALAADTWTDDTGQFQVEAEFLLLHGQDVYLRRTDGVTIKVPLARLSATSQRLAQRLAAEPAAATPREEGVAPDATEAPEGAETPDAAMRVLMASWEAGDFGTLWDALPTSYQDDVNEVVRLFAENMDRDIWNAATRMLGKLTGVLKNQKPLILGWVETLEQGTDAEALGQGMDALAEILDTVLQSELGDLEQLKAFDGQAFLEGTGRQLGEQMAAMSEEWGDQLDPAMMPVPGGFPGMELPDLDNVQFSTVQMDGDTATLRVEQNGDVNDYPLVRVDGRWLPQAMVDEWDEGIAELKEQLAAMPEQLVEVKQMLLSPLSPVRVVEGVLDQLGAARNQQEFNQVIEQITEMAGQMLGDMLGGFGEFDGFENGGDLPFEFPDGEPQPFGEPLFDEPDDEPDPIF